MMKVKKEKLVIWRLRNEVNRKKND